jgi:hypothetical protein
MKIEDIIKLSNDGLTEEEFIENFNQILEAYSIPYLMFSQKNLRLEEYVDVNSITTILDDIYMSNPEKNKWCLSENMSENLKLFLRLNGESE